MSRPDPRLLYLAASMAVNTFGFSLVLPFLSVYLHSEQGVPMEAVGGIYAAAGLAGALGMLGGGELSDRQGPRAVMVWTLLARAVNLALLGLCLFLEAPLFFTALLIVANATLRSLFTPACNAAAAAVGGRTDQLRAFGWQRIGVNAGWALGPVVGGLLADWNYAAMFLAAVPLTLASVWLAARVHVELPPRRARFRPRDLLPTRSEARLWPFFLGAVFLYAMTTQLVTTIPVFAHEVRGLPKREVGLVFMVNGLGVVLLQSFATRVGEWLGVRAALLLGIGLYTAGYLLLGVVHGFAGLALAITVVTAGEVLSGPAVMAAAGRLLPPERAGRVMGWLGLTNAAGLSLGAAVGGVVMGSLAHTPLGVWSVLSVTGLLAAALLARAVRPAAHAPQPGAPDEALDPAVLAATREKVAPGGASVDGKREAR